MIERILMMKKMLPIAKFTSWMLLVALLVTAALPFAAAQASAAAQGAATIGQLADYFLAAADDYNPEASRERVLEGFDRNARATRLEMFVLASRAFGKLPAPEGHAKNIAPRPADLTGAPEWARADLKNLADGGALAASDLGFEALAAPAGAAAEGEAPAEGIAEAEASLEDLMDLQAAANAKSHAMADAATLRDAQIVAARFFALSGTNPKDDFYTAVNKEGLDALKVPAGAETAGGSSAVTENTNRQLRELILEIVNSAEAFPQGSARQKIRTLYQNVLDLEARNRAGIEPLRKYLDAVDAARNFSELNAAVALAVNELGNMANGLWPMVAVTDEKDSSRRIMQLYLMPPYLSQSDYDDPDSALMQEYRKTMVRQLTAVGESEEDAQRHVDGLLRMERGLAGAMSSAEELADPQRTAVRYTMAKLDEMMPQAKPSELFTAIGLKPETPMQYFDDQWLAHYAAWCTEDNLELFQSLQKIALFRATASF